MLEEGDTLEVHAEPDDFEAIRDTLAARSFTPASAEVGMVPQTTVKLEGREAESMLKLMEALDELDDVKEVFANFDISEEAMMQAAG